MVEQCMLCRLDFDVTEDLVPVPTRDNRGPRMFWIDGTLHQFPRHVPKNKKNKIGAFCLPPRQDPEPVIAESSVVEAPATSIEEEHTVPIETQPDPDTRLDVEQLAESLNTVWHKHTEIEPYSSEAPVRPADELIGTVAEGVVISWTPGRAGHSGFVRLKPRLGRANIYIREEDVVTYGTVHVGTSVRFTVVDSRGNCLEGREIEMFREENP